MISDRLSQAVHYLVIVWRRVAVSLCSLESCASSPSECLLSLLREGRGGVVLTIDERDAISQMTSSVTCDMVSASSS